MVSKKQQFCVVHNNNQVLSNQDLADIVLIKEVKLKLEQKMGFTTCQMLIVFDGQILSDSFKIKDLAILNQGPGEVKSKGG